MSKKNLLIIDDDEEDLETFCDALLPCSERYNCITALSGKHGLSVLENSKHLPDYIFLDLNTIETLYRHSFH